MQTAAPKTVRVVLPPRFATDRIERDLDCGDGKFTGRGYEADLTADVLEDFLDDAEHYAHPHGPDHLPPGLKSSAIATVRALKAARAEAS